MLGGEPPLYRNTACWIRFALSLCLYFLSFQSIQCTVESKPWCRPPQPCAPRTCRVRKPCWPLTTRVTQKRLEGLGDCSGHAHIALHKPATHCPPALGPCCCHYCFPGRPMSVLQYLLWTKSPFLHAVIHFLENHLLAGTLFPEIDS